MPIENMHDVMNEIVTNGVSIEAYNYICISVVVLISAGIGTYFGQYFKMRGKEKALIDSFEGVKKRLEQSTLLTEEIRASIGMNTIEHQIKFSKLYEKRIQVIEKLYHLIVQMEETGKTFLYSASPIDNPGDEFEKARDAISKFIDYSRLNQFWVEEGLFEEIESFALRIDKIVHRSKLRCSLNTQDPLKLSEALDQNKLSIEEITKEIPKAKEGIINSIRKALDPKST